MQGWSGRAAWLSAIMRRGFSVVAGGMAASLVLAAVGVSRRFVQGVMKYRHAPAYPFGCSTVSRYCLGDSPVACLKATQKLLAL